MALNTLTFFVDFRPVAWKRPAGKGVRHDSQVADKAAFSLKALASIYAARPELKHGFRPWYATDALHVHIDFLFKEKAGKQKSVQLPDIDNLAKFVLDAMQSQCLDGVIWTDDRQVVSLSVTKSISQRDATLVTIKRFSNG